MATNSEPIPRFFLDPNVRFPRRPVFARGLLIRDVPRGLGVDFQGGPRRFILRGSSAASVMEFLQNSLDGSRSLEEVLAVRPDGLSAAVLLQTLEILHRRGVLAEADGSTTRASCSPPDQCAHVSGESESFWERKLTITRSALAADTISQRLQAASVVLVVGGLVGQLTSELVGRAGIPPAASIVLDEPILNAEAMRGGWEGRDGAGTLDEFASLLRSRLELADLLVVSMRGATQLLTATVNEVCLSTRTPFIFASEDGEQADISFVDPLRSACLVCKELRTALVSEFALEDYLFGASEEGSGSWYPRAVPAGESMTAASLIAAHVAGEAVRYLSRGAPVVFVNRSVTIDLVSGTSRHHPILRVPRCPACSSATLSATLEEPRNLEERIDASANVTGTRRPGEYGRVVEPERGSHSSPVV